MKPSAVHRCVARATGESLRRVRHLGFLLVVPRAPRGMRPGEQAQPGPAARNEDAAKAPRTA